MLINNRFWRISAGFEPLEYSLPIIVGIDPSKTGYAMTIGDEWGKDFKMIELSGSGMETSDFITELKFFITQYFSRVQFACVGYESMILKKGLGYYHSSEVLHDVRVATKEVFNLLGVKPVEVNNMAWKGAILPDGYRSHKEKGSKRYCLQLDPEKFSGKSDNITDSYCIYKYLVQKRGLSVITCTAVEKAVNKVGIAIVQSESPEARACTVEFNYNPQFTLQENANFFSNRSMQMGKCRIRTEDITLDDIYRYAYGFNNAQAKDISVIIIPEVSDLKGR